MIQYGKKTLSAEAAPATDSVWFLAGQLDESDSIRHFPIHSTPFQIGRRNDLPLCLRSPTVSNLHAEIVAGEDGLSLRDLGSTNGTYVNGLRIRDAVPLKQDDLVQFADVAFRLRRQVADVAGRTVQEDVCDRALALVQFDKLMTERAVVPFFQPIVRMGDQQTIAYEVLGRSRLFGLETPRAMFSAAAQLNLEVELSRMFRWEGVQVSSALAELPHLFVNTHPAELVEPGLVDSIRAVRELHPLQPITLEIHESAITSPAAMRDLRLKLRDLEVGLAYDDFGAGQARLVELVEVSPDYLKFDMELIQGIHAAPPSRQQMLATLVRMASELEIVPLAEGVEYEAESVACRQLGFQLAQGFFFGRPAPITSYCPQA